MECQHMDMSGMQSFSPSDCDAIVSRVDRYPSWTVRFVKSDRVESAQVRAGCAASAPLVTLAWESDLVQVFARWANGRSVRAGACLSLSDALAFLSMVVEGAFDDHVAPSLPGD